ncbi:MAG TPA: sugar porter family MFS transporter [Victivallales bacterium]|nr:sugar porter family MFS transporter [Victivallales bacterium]
MEVPEKTKQPITFIAIFIIIVSSLGGCLYGLDIGIIGGSIGLIKKEMHLSNLQIGWIVGAVLYGTAIATLLAGMAANKFGRKKLIITSSVIFIIGIFISTVSSGFYSLLSGRLIMGFGVGIAGIVIPLYITESTPAVIRGRAVACFQLFITLGILFAYLIGLIFIESGNWRVMYAVLAIPGIILFVCAFMLPESPSWLFMKNMFEKSKKTLIRIHKKNIADKIFTEMEELQSLKKHDKSDSIFKKAYIIPFLLAFFISCLTPATGINSILQYAPFIFEQSGVHSPFITMMLGSGVVGINVIMTIIAVTLIDKLGRKPLLKISTGCVFGSLILLAAASYMPVSTVKITLLTVGMLGYIASFAVGCGVVVWLTMSELLPSKIRAMGLAVCLFANSLLASVLSTLFLVIKAHLGYGGLFLLLAAFTLIYFIIAAFFLPETKNKTIEEIEKSFRK